MANANPRCPTAMLTADESSRLRALMRERGPERAARELGNVDVRTLYRAAAEQPVSRLTVTVLRTVLAPVQVPVEVAPPPPPAPAPRPRRARPAAVVPQPDPIEPPEQPTEGAMFWTVSRAGGRRMVVAEFTTRAGAEKAFSIDRRVAEVVEIATGRVVMVRPPRDDGKV